MSERGSRRAPRRDRMNELIVAKHGRITELTLNCASAANALSASLVSALSDALDAALRDDTQLLVVRSEGKNFCAGFDLAHLGLETDETLIDRLTQLELLLQRIYYAPCATIALVQGGAHGAGFDLVNACDYRIAAPTAHFRMPSWRMGIAIGTQRLASRVGAETAFAWLRSAARLGAEQALGAKLATEIADPVTWPRLVQDISDEVAALPEGSYAQLKLALLRDTRRADLAALQDSLRTPPIKLRMQNYLQTL
jgi:enoyl-CoA hydratase